MKSFLEALKNPYWQFVATSCISIVIGAAAILFQWLLTRSKKELSYILLANAPVVSIREEYQKNLEIRFHGRPVKVVHLIIFKLINSGHKAILPTDYVEPVIVRFAGDSRILTASVVETHPASIRPGYAEVIGNSQGGEVIFPPELLNSRDWVKIHLLVSDFQGPITVTGRIVDVTEIKESKDFPGRKKLTAYTIVFIGGVISSLFIPFPYSGLMLGLSFAISVNLFSHLAATMGSSSARLDR